jgi:hypothetical protein
MARNLDDLMSKQCGSCANNDLETPEKAFLGGHGRLKDLHEQIEPYWQKGKPVPQELYEKQDRVRHRMSDMRHRLAPGGMTFHPGEHEDDNDLCCY